MLFAAWRPGRLNVRSTVRRRPPRGPAAGSNEIGASAAWRRTSTDSDETGTAASTRANRLREGQPEPLRHDVVQYRVDGRVDEVQHACQRHDEIFGLYNEFISPNSLYGTRYFRLSLHSLTSCNEYLKSSYSRHLALTSVIKINDFWTCWKAMKRQFVVYNEAHRTTINSILHLFQIQVNFSSDRNFVDF